MGFVFTDIEKKEFIQEMRIGLLLDPRALAEKQKDWGSFGE